MMARKKGGLLKGVAAAAASYAAKAAVDFAKNPENMQKMAQFVNDQQIGDKLKQAAANVHMPVALDPAAKVAKQLDIIETTLEQYADQFPADAPIGQWKNTLKNFRLMNTRRSKTESNIHICHFKAPWQINSRILLLGK